MVLFGYDFVAFCQEAPEKIVGCFLTERIQIMKSSFSEGLIDDISWLPEKEREGISDKAVWDFDLFQIRIRPKVGSRVPGSWTLHLIPEFHIQWRKF